MRILMLAPQPFFAERGTPISTLCRLEALARLGHRVDLLTYPMGEHVEIEGLRILRLRKLPFIRHVGIGPSLKKLLLDPLLFARATRLLRGGRYDCVHTHEEGAFLGAALRRLFGVPHLYDMHSSLPEQLVSYGVISPGLPLRLARVAERWLLRRTDVVIAVSSGLAEIAREANPRASAVVVHNKPWPLSSAAPDPREMKRLRGSLGLSDGALIVYTGNLSRNQGAELLVSAMPQVIEADDSAQLVLAGGEPRQVRRLRRMARQLNVDDRVTLLGRQSASVSAALIEMATVLVSPRRTGTVPPLKVYSYLRAGKPIVATRIAAHTEVLSDDTALLVASEPGAFANAIVSLLRDPELRERLGRNAHEQADACHDQARFDAGVREAYAAIESLRRDRAGAEADSPAVLGGKPQ